MSIERIIEREFPQTQFPHYAPRFEKHKLRALLLEAVEAERKDVLRLKYAMINIIVHTPHNETAPNELLVGLLANINRIANAAIAAEGK
jgi:hypothetical protein